MSNEAFKRGIGDLKSTIQGVVGVSGKLNVLSEIPLEKVKPSPHYQPREVFNQEKLEALAESIASKGQLEAGLVVWNEEEQVYHIIAGERRYQACLLAGVPTYKAEILQDKHYTKAQLAEIALISNIQRDNLKPIEIAEHLQKIKDLGNYKSSEELAKIIGSSRTSVDELLTINTLPTSIKQEALASDVNTAYLVELVRFGSDPEMQRKTWEDIKAGKYTVAKLRLAKRNFKNKQQGNPTRPLKNKLISEVEGFHKRLEKAVNEQIVLNDEEYSTVMSYLLKIEELSKKLLKF